MEFTEKTEKEKVYSKAIELWGIEAQLGMLMEECGELIQATNKFMRGKGVEGLIEEIADVEIMIEQIKLGLNIYCLSQRIKTKKEEKFKRLVEVIEK